MTTSPEPFRHNAELRPLLGEVNAAYRRRDDRRTAELLARAVLIAPDRLDLRFDLAGRFVQDGDIPRAMDEYRAVLAIASGDVLALTNAAHWARHLGLDGESAAFAARLRAVRPAREAELRRVWEAIDADAAQPATDALPDHPGGGDGFVIVALGYALAPDGSMREPMYDRLRKTLEAAGRYPAARIVVSGGVPQGGRVEATEMRRWLAGNGVAEERIDDEGWSRDVVENLLYSRNILERRAARRAIVVTSMVNVRRVRAALAVLRWSAGSAWECDVAGAIRGDTPERTDAGPGNLKVYRDALRMYGIFMMHSPPELVEL